MSDYWGVPEQEYELSLLQFARKELKEMGYTVLSEKVEVCSGAGAMTLTAILKKEEMNFGLYIHDGPKQRKTRGPPIIWMLRLLPEMKSAEDLRNFILNHQHDFSIILAPENTILKDRKEVKLNRIYKFLYNSKVKDLYDSDLSTAADVLKKRLRKSQD
ncbi:MAG: hypothetical protein OIN88_06570 [Candidatus Methanoperedens sp.]|nr:hypothetical protein [Candidatus Methanoperedens sp.]MCZ7360080.1 hypothetical protein [Candidatus Methanoperedens sp.]HLB71216.1 hypothetical protein [Candidatus Methanoperedens sp.]